MFQNIWPLFILELKVKMNRDAGVLGLALLLASGSEIFLLYLTIFSVNFKDEEKKESGVPHVLVHLADTKNSTHRVGYK